MAEYSFRWAPLVVVGLVAGLVNVAAGVTMYLSGIYFEPWSLRVMVVLLAAYIAVGNWWYGKHVLGGQTTYWKALLVGMAISVATGLVYITYNVVSISFVYADFLGQMIQAEYARASAGMDTGQAAQLLESLRAQVTLGSLVVGNFTAVSRLGTLLSVLISVGFLKRWRARPAVMERV